MTKHAELEKIIQDAIAKDHNFTEILKIAKSGTGGKIWLVGGFVFRNIAAGLYGTPVFIKDYDFLAERVLKIKKLPAGWRMILNTYKNPKIQKGNLSIDLIPLDKHFAVREWRRKPTIKMFLDAVPLTIQSIAYDLDQNKLIGEVGIKTLLTKTVGVKDKKMLSFYLNQKKLTLEQYVKDKVTDFGFRMIMRQKYLKK